MTALDAATLTVVRDCLAVQAGEQVLIVVDEPTRAIGEAVRAAAAAQGADAVLAIMDPRSTDGAEPPPTIAAALAAADVFIAPTSRSLSHTRARKAASDAGARGATMPGVTAEMLARVMAVDFPLMAARSRAVAALLSQSDTAQVRCPLGTDLTLSLDGRRGVADDGALTEPGAFGNLPCGEGFISPAGGDGTAVVTSLAPLGMSAGGPTTITVREGRLVAADRGHGPEWIARLREHGSDGINLAELGVGTNDRATLTGNVLEDEKILGTVHVAFGASAGIGGTVSVGVHLDAVVLDASLTIGDTEVLRGGRFVLELDSR